MKSLIAAIALVSIAGQAAALSCVRPDPVATFARVSAADETYYLLYGTLDFEAVKQPKGLVNERQNPAPVAARFDGFALNQSGFNTPYKTAAVLQITCAGPWCGSQESGVKSLFFAQVQDDQIVVTASPCGGNIFATPQPDVLDAMTACMNGNCP